MGSGRFRGSQDPRGGSAVACPMRSRAGGAIGRTRRGAWRRLGAPIDRAAGLSVASWVRRSAA